MDDKKRWLLLAIADIASTVLGGGILPYVIMGILHDFEIFNAVIFVIIAIMLVILQCFLEPSNTKVFILSAAAKWGVASCIIMSSSIVAFIAVGREVSKVEYVILAVTILLYAVLLIKRLFFKKKKRRSRRRVAGDPQEVPIKASKN